MRNEDMPVWATGRLSSTSYKVFFLFFVCVSCKLLRSICICSFVVVPDNTNSFFFGLVICSVDNIKAYTVL